MNSCSHRAACRRGIAREPCATFSRRCRRYRTTWCTAISFAGTFAAGSRKSLATETLARRSWDWSGGTSRTRATLSCASWPIGTAETRYYPMVSADSEGLLEDLGRPEAYPAPRPTTIRLVTTHVSWVFITDHDVWKLKRPVDYGFLDYTTLDRRRHFCDEEVRVNSRLAPDVYLGVVPVRLDKGRHGFTSDGTVVDYAVRMRRLPETASAESLLLHGHLTHEHLSRLAGRLAAFYAASPPASGGGSGDVLRTNVEENFTQVRP